MSGGRDPIATLREFVRAKKTGALAIRDGKTVAEVRLSAGNIDDATGFGATGEKALYRALSLAGAAWSFEHGAPGARRIRTPTEQILSSAPRVLAEMERLRSAFPDPHERPLLAVETDPALPLAISTSGRALLVHVRAPILLGALLDRVAAPDLEILAALHELERTGRVILLASPKERIPLGTDEELSNLARSVRQRRRLQVGGAVRIVFAGSPHRLAVLAHGASCLEGASPLPHGAPAVPMPHPVARLPLHGDLPLEIALCPLVPAYSPLWPMAMKGTFAVVRVDEAAEHLIDPACEASGLRPVDARELVPSYDPTRVADVAKLVTRALAR
ncbi:hypothetical protein [Pendulispora albinea]|uniref:DUF4388 domain-containing protein n=1 Tax=Pendulispora albinea TaxID=2741071 RepID=A0ABZ2LUP0_9BACT